MSTVLDFFLHLDVHLQLMIASMGVWIYVVLFLVIFCETGLVITPFLPGDSLLFAIGAICGIGGLNIAIIIPLLMLAANTGDAVNYFTGKYLGVKLLKSENSKYLNKKHLERTHKFYEKHGGKTLIFARFVPIVRTFAPFVAGVGQMTFRKFAAFSIVGGFIWVASLVWLGYAFGNSDFVKKNFSLVIGAIILLSVLPVVVEFFKHRSASRTSSN